MEKIVAGAELGQTFRYMLSGRQRPLPPEFEFCVAAVDGGNELQQVERHTQLSSGLEASSCLIEPTARGIQPAGDAIQEQLRWLVELAAGEEP